MTSLAVSLVVAAPVHAQESQVTDAARVDAGAKPTEVSTTVDSDKPDAVGQDIVVRGLRASLAKSRDQKRRAAQIVDVITADDIGKLPDKNVVDALQRVPGVIMDRTRGEGGDFSIRGLSGVMTTVDGTPTFSGINRTTNLADMPADLVSGIQVYKTRTPDQIEGSKSGVVNLTLRKPTDFKSGWTVALNTRGDYSDQVKKINPFVSGVVSYNTDTDLGKFGFVLSGSHNYVRYNESMRGNSNPVQLRSPRQIVEPTTTPANLYVPSSSYFFARAGYNQRDSFNTSIQWRPNDHWSFSSDFAISRADRPNYDDDFGFPVRDTFSAYPAPRLTNLVIGSDGRSISSLTVETRQPLGPGKNYADATWNNKSAKQTIEYSDDVAHLIVSHNYAVSDYKLDQIYHKIQFANNPIYDMVFNTDKDPRGGVAVTLRGIDLSDPGNYSNVARVTQTHWWSGSTEREIKFDLQLQTGWLFDFLKFGGRRAKRTFRSSYADRGTDESLGIPISTLSGYKLVPISTALQGSGDDMSWMIGDANSITNVWSTLRPLVAKRFPDFAEGDWPITKPYNKVNGFETSYAAYGLAHYQFKLLIPFEGIVGARVVHAKTVMNSFQYTSNPNGEDIIDPVQGRGNTVDVLPSVNAIGHITDGLQLRVSWTKDMQRPALDNLNAHVSLDSPTSTNPAGSGGNSKLRPVYLKKIDASLEWYFGKTGSVSVALFDWREEGTIFNDFRYESLPGYTVPVRVTRPYNGGRSKYRGIELQGTTFLPILPWLFKYVGVNGNFTLFDSKVQYPIFDEATKTTNWYESQQFWKSKYAFNAAVFYEHAGLNARVAYNWRSKRVDSLDPNNRYRNLFTDPTQRLDASINYDINEHFSVGAEATNLTRKGDRNFWGYYTFPQEITYFARTFALTARARF
ncbi:TonB-dependent receptor [Sphingomonas endophytica]|uniref:TonB-dependent receptor n=1 Tax=Sphingomonas endophytica TaxID=869719 RepID=A0ABR6N798_9SPHN|nr:TonB-dependent receptor [Sphingomonas endophytica]MBB5726636.1 TonB-dependent receptor [Sphingomonas endophytica]